MADISKTFRGSKSGAARISAAPDYRESPKPSVFKFWSSCLSCCMNRRHRSIRIGPISRRHLFWRRPSSSNTNHRSSIRAYQKRSHDASSHLSSSLSTNRHSSRSNLCRSKSHGSSCRLSSSSGMSRRNNRNLRLCQRRWRDSSSRHLSSLDMSRCSNTSPPCCRRIALRFARK